ncbi:MAG: hypothetical protein KDA45_12165 [Planctomycetales bacterium]|nr:hypothetical protein [Planctomycetales bacterium]
MSDNPYAEPPRPNPSASNVGGPDRQLVLRKVTPAAIGLIVAGILNGLLGIWGLLSAVLTLLGVGPAIAAQQQQAEQLEELRKQGLDWAEQLVETLYALQGPLGLTLSLIQLVAAAVIVYGGLQMKNLQSYGLSLGAAILALIPLVSCCCTGLPIGIWAIVVLVDPHVKQSFSGPRA